MNNYNDNDRDNNGRLHDSNNGRYRSDMDHDTGKKAGIGIGIGTILLLIALAIGAWFLFNNKDDNASTAARDAGQATSTVVDKVKDGAAEVPQAVKDATTDGDQKTTRPNGDESKSQLDQKPSN